MISTANCPRNEEGLLKDDPSQIGRVRQVLARTRYDTAGVLEVLGADGAGQTFGRRDLPQLLHRCGSGSPLEVLIRLFLLGVPVGAPEFRRAVAPMAPAEWFALGLAEPSGAEVGRRVEILPGTGLLYAQHAPYHRRARQPRRQTGIMKLTPDSIFTEHLAQLTVRRPAAAALDLGTGGGLHALLAATHSQWVVGVDCNPRALNLAAFNAHLNGLDHVAFRAGDFFAPVAGELFDLIVSNPPFVISPEQVGVFRDSGLPSDLVCRQIIEAAPRFLRPGGFVHVLVNWAHVKGENPQARLRDWVAGSGCDAWVLCFHTWDPAAYGSIWLPPVDGGDTGAEGRRFETWLAYYSQQGIEAISYGLVTLRARSGGPNWFVCEDAPALRGPCGLALAQNFARRDFLEGLPDDRALLEAHLRVSPLLRWDRSADTGRRGWSAAVSRLRLGQGLGYRMKVDAHVIKLIGRCRGVRPLGSVLHDLAETLQRDPAEVIPAGLELARHLLTYGYLEPSTAGPAATLVEQANLPGFLWGP
jgi:hypothetical protein